MKRTLLILLCTAVLCLSPLTAWAGMQNSVNGVYQLGGNTFIDTDDNVYATKDMASFTELSYGSLIFVNNTLFGVSYDKSQYKHAWLDSERYSVYSQDGEQFKPVSIDGKNGLLENMMYFKKHYVAMCKDGIAVSENGKDWRVRVPLTLNNKSTFVFNGSLFFTFFDGGLYATSDAVTFSEIKNFEEKYGAVKMLYNDQFVVSVKESDQLQTFYVSNDGLNFRLLKRDGKLLENIEGDGMPWYTNEDEADNHTLSNALPGAQPFLIKNMDEEKAVYSYELSDLLTATVQVSTPLRQFSSGGHVYQYDGLSAGDDWSGFGAIYGAIYSESSSWVMGDFLFQDAATDGKGTVLITGDHGAMLVGHLSENEDAYEMTVNAYSFNPDGSGIHLLKYANGQYFIGTFSGGLYASPDGIHWTGHAAMPVPINDIIFAYDRYYAACEDGLYTSADAKNWKRIYQTDAELLSLAYGNSQIIACGQNSTIVAGRITDGKFTWKSVSIEPAYATLHSVAFGGGTWVIGGGSGWGGSGLMFRSTDGIAWSPVHDGEEGFEPDTSEDIMFSNTTYTIKYIGGRFVSAGLNRSANSAILYGSANGLDWEVKSYIHYWGLDVFEPLSGVDAVINSYAIYINGEVWESSEVTTNPNNYKKLIPINSLIPAFTKTEATSVAGKE